MSIRFDSYSFFDGTSMTPVTQISWADYWRGVIPDGVVAGIGEEMRPFGNSTGMVVYIGTGAIMIDNHRAVVSTQKALQLAAADANYDRIDTIVARIQYGNEDESYVELDVLTGTAEPDPAAPEITQSTGGVYEVKLAEVTVHAGVVTITVDDVNDTRNIYAGGEESRSWKNNDDEIMVRGDVVMMDRSDEGGILKCLEGQPPLGVVTSLNIGPGQYGKIESIAGKIAEVRCTEDAVTIGDALVCSDQKGLAKAGYGWAAGVAVQPKASGLIGNVRSLLTVFTQLPIQNKWWIIDGITDENVLAVYRFAGVGSMVDALRDLANDQYTLERTGNTVTWDANNGFTIPSVAAGRAGLNNADLNSLGNTIVSAAVRFSGASTSASKRLGLIGISATSRALSANGWVRYHNTNTGAYWVDCQGPAVGNYRVQSVPLKAEAVMGANFSAPSNFYIDGEQYVASAYSPSGGSWHGSSAVTLGQMGYDSAYGGSGASYHLLSAVFYNTALEAQQWADLYKQMRGA